MILLIPIGGCGKRFKSNGYKKPKALINIFGKPILYYLLDSLNLNNIEFIYIPYNNEYSNYNFESMLRKDYPNINFVFFQLKNITQGAPETINIALNNLDIKDDKSILCLDCDNFYLCNIINMWNGDNIIFSTKNTTMNPIYSYIKINDDNTIIDIKEKVKISDLACTGAYGFKSIKELKKYTLKIIEHNNIQQSEFYTSGVIKKMIEENIQFKNILIDKDKYVCLGTPIQLKQFYNNTPRISSLTNNPIIEIKRICFDLDNTLVTYPLINNDYTTVEPIEKNISLLRYLKQLGNIIIIYTARRMKTHNGNIGKINCDIGKITFDTLDKFNIPYDEIYFGKPYADYYIDDLAINCFYDIEKELGFYKNIIEPRSFNLITENSIETITKQGLNLDGEIYYYLNIPNEIKDMFPIILYYSKNSYVIEKISGLSVTDMYLSEILTEQTLINILNSIKRIQNIKLNNSKEINIYTNYAIKLQKRFIEYDYSKFENNKKIYDELIEKLNIYETNNLGKKTVIHGDPVFTNILINNYEKIKFIDMRGKIGNELSIEGDWLYDWAKVYQSLIGYDSILLDKFVSFEYKNEMIQTFIKYFISNYSEKDFKNLKLITKSLLFSLIPLHNNEKCIEYYKLISCKFLS